MHWARCRVLRVCHVVSVRVLMCVRVVHVRGMAVREARRLGRMAGAKVRSAAMVLRERQRRARRPPVAALLHVRSWGTSRCATARAAPRARQRMSPRLVRAPVLALAARHPFHASLPFPLVSPPSG
ncbi:unnamed protein product [Parnassius apollo]|uniref:(apollo) hypothetical protein n=1 Tax=Parnassius apollo TaxID=110799 RepID=A0A8S3WMJ5_PARAO|nr:unnamed protein product [Parnassius apollo]